MVKINDIPKANNTIAAEQEAKNGEAIGVTADSSLGGSLSPTELAEIVKHDIGETPDGVATQEVRKLNVPGTSGNSLERQKYLREKYIETLNGMRDNWDKADSHMTPQERLYAHARVKQIDRAMAETLQELKKVETALAYQEDSLEEISSDDEEDYTSEAVTVAPEGEESRASTTGEILTSGILALEELDPEIKTILERAQNYMDNPDRLPPYPFDKHIAPALTHSIILERENMSFEEFTNLVDQLKEISPTLHDYLMDNRDFYHVATNENGYEEWKHGVAPVRITYL